MVVLKYDANVALVGVAEVKGGICVGLEKQRESRIAIAERFPLNYSLSHSYFTIQFTLFIVMPPF